MSPLINGWEVIDMHEAWGVEMPDGSVVEMDDDFRSGIDARTSARSYQKAFGGYVVEGRTFYSAWKRSGEHGGQDQHGTGV